MVKGNSGGQFSEFKALSEAVCETVGSVMNQHLGRNRHLQLLYFSIELVLRWNLGPLQYHNNFVKEVYNRDKKEYLRRTKRVDKVVTKDLTKSDAVASFQKRAEEKSQLQASFWH